MVLALSAMGPLLLEQQKAEAFATSSLPFPIPCTDLPKLNRKKPATVADCPTVLEAPGQLGVMTYWLGVIPFLYIGQIMSQEEVRP